VNGSDLTGTLRCAESDSGLFGGNLELARADLVSR
jgi:hypothetical protein